MVYNGIIGFRHAGIIKGWDYVLRHWQKVKDENRGKIQTLFSVYFLKAALLTQPARK